MLPYWDMSSIPLCYLGARSQLFLTGTHTFFQQHQARLISPCKSTTAESRGRGGDHVQPYLPTKRGDLRHFNPSFPNPEALFPALLFSFLFKSHGPSSSDENASPFTPEEVQVLLGYRCIPSFSFSLAQ